MLDGPTFSYEEPTPCPCGELLPAMKFWHHWGRDWSHVTCSGCLRHYVDEEDYVAVHEPLDEDEGCGCPPRSEADVYLARAEWQGEAPDDYIRAALWGTNP